MLWLWATLAASALQTARNAAQASLTARLGTIGATQVRFLFGLPFAMLFLAAITWGTGEAIPALTAHAGLWIAGGAVAQILATALMLRSMAGSSFAITTAWIKTEPVLVALFGAAVLGDHLSVPMLGAIALAIAGVLITTVKPGALRQMWREAQAARLGLMAGALFGAAAIGFRGGILALPDGGFLIRAATALTLGLALQTAILGIWMGLFDRAALRGSLQVWRSSLGTGFLGALASQLWFVAFSLTSAANVRTLALIEVVFAQGVARVAFGQRLTRRQALGIAVMLAGVALLLWVQG